MNKILGVVGIATLALMVVGCRGDRGFGGRRGGGSINNRERSVCANQALRFINALNGQTIDFSVQGTACDGDELFGQRAFLECSRYCCTFDTYGNTTFQAKTAGTTTNGTFTAGQQIAQQDVRDLLGAKTVFLYYPSLASGAQPGLGGAKFLILSDDLAIDNSSLKENAGIRVVNFASKFAPFVGNAVDIYLLGDGAAIGSAVQVVAGTAAGIGAPTSSPEWTLFDGTGVPTFTPQYLLSGSTYPLDPEALSNYLNVAAGSYSVLVVPVGTTPTLTNKLTGVTVCLNKGTFNTLVLADGATAVQGKQFVDNPLCARKCSTRFRKNQVCPTGCDECGNPIRANDNQGRRRDRNNRKDRRNNTATKTSA